MAWDGSGNFSRTKDWTNDRDAAIKILATRHDENDDELTTGINACITRDGQAKVTADLKPNADNTYSLGSAVLRWINVFLTSVKFQQASFVGTLQAATLTASRTYTLPDRTGSLLMLSAPGTISTDTVLVAADFPGAKIITATATLTLPVASTVAAGVGMEFKSTTTGNVLLAPNGTDTIDSVNASVRVPSFDTWELVSNGSTGWYVIRKGNMAVGDIKHGGYGTAGPDCIACDGASLLRTTYAGLFAVISTTFGTVDGTHFTVPDLRGRAVIGVGTGSGLTARALAATGGEETHILTLTESPAHTHTTPGNNGGNFGSSAWFANGTTSANNTVTSSSAGSDGAHNNMQPFIALNAYIKT